MFKFKSEAHRTMFLRMVALQIRCNLLRRFGGVRQQECRLLRTKSARQLLLHWAEDIVDRLPNEAPAQAAFVARESYKVPQNVLRQDNVQTILRNDVSIRWLVARLEDGSALVPKPYFPSLLRYNMMQFPFAPYDIDKARHLYGLLKFPFYQLTADVNRSPAEKFKGLKQPLMPNECKVPGKHNIASEAIYQDGGTLATKDYIYAPSELETGLSGKVI
ncbi:uncharacterized protein BXIN_1329 [Babesia sp. Xinjiang]|uniref:uncharacterized protein n=1 Tax=Babesia sp. Xinjiang TaxID=462227 RepID=UPI000A265DB5|nr:uncharacterized protein BXIN_1329 [Babesia sp. Xinjiang]ORM40095.1 hypothetical protein BXIN_1329 [Babesia sp. Xinjiang]